jgi:sulfur-oxidizing protein SoxX
MAARFGALAVLLAVSIGPAVAGQIVPFEVTGDEIARPLGGYAGDAERGRRIVLDRATGNCLICHRVPVPQEPFQGDMGPDLTGVGARLTAGQIRLRLVDPTRLNDLTVMPPYYRVDRLTRVAARFAGAPVLSAEEIEDVVRWLETLR